MSVWPEKVKLVKLSILYFQGVVLDDPTFLPKKTLTLTEFDQKQSMGSGGVEINNCVHDDSQDDVAIKCWIPSHTALLKLLSLCPKLNTIRLLTEERHLSVFAEALSDMDEHFDIEELEV